MKYFVLMNLVFWGSLSFATSPAMKPAPVKSALAQKVEKYSSAKGVDAQLTALEVPKSQHKAFKSLMKKLGVKNLAPIRFKAGALVVGQKPHESTLKITNKTISEFELDGYKFRKTSKHTPETLYNYILRIHHHNQKGKKVSWFNKFVLRKVNADEYGATPKWLQKKGLTLSAFSWGNPNIIDYVSQKSQYQPNKVRVTCNQNPPYYQLKIVTGSGYEGSGELHNDYIMTRHTRHLAPHFSQEFINKVEASRIDETASSEGFRDVKSDWSVVHISNPVDSTINFPGQHEKTVKLGGWRKNGINNPFFKDQYYNCNNKKRECKKIPNLDDEKVHHNARQGFTEWNEVKIVNMLAECCEDEDKVCESEVSKHEMFGLDAPGVDYHGKGSGGAK